MKNTTLILFFIFTISLLSCRKSEKADFAIQNVTVIDATGAAAKSGMTVLITGNRIRKIDKTHTIRLARDVKVVDGSGKFLIPGLWDMHAHIYREDKPVDVIGHKFISIFIANGITNVRVMLGWPELHQWRDEISAGKLIGPRMILASVMAEGRVAGQDGSYGISSVEEGRQFVRKIMSENVDFVKVGSYLPRDVYFAIADEAKKQGIPFAGHVPYSTSGVEASDAGQLSFEHQYSILIPCSKLEEEIRTDFMNMGPTTRNRTKRYAEIEYSEQKAREFFAHLVKNGTYVCPTLVVWDEFTKRDKEDLANDPRLNYMPPDIKTRMKLMNDNFSDVEVKADMRRRHSRSRYIVGEMNKAGVKILAGTDNGAAPYVFHGFGLHHELKLLVESGLTPMEALQSATINAAKCAGRLDSLGTIEEGKIADLVLLEENPLSSIENTKKINSVFYNGKHFDRSKLDKILNNLEKLVQ
jgi:hypothetical protein